MSRNFLILTNKSGIIFYNVRQYLKSGDAQMRLQHNLDCYMNLAPPSEKRKKGKRSIWRFKGWNWTTLFSLETLLPLLYIFILGRAIWGGLFFFAPAFLAAYSGKKGNRYIWPLVTVSLLSLVTVNPDDIFSWKSLELLLTGLCLQVGLYGRGNLQWKVPLLVLLAQIGAGIAELYPLFPSTYAYLMIITEGLICAGLSVAFLVLLQSTASIKAGIGLSTEQWVSWVLAGIGLLMGLQGISLGGYHLVSILERFAILLTGLVFGGPAGAAAGVIVGSASFARSEFLMASIGVYAVCGLLCGTFRNLGKAGVIGGYLTGQLILSTYLGNQEAIARELLISLVSAGLLVVFPARWRQVLDHLSAQVRGKREIDKMRTLRDYLFQRFKELEDVFEQLSSAFSQASSAREEPIAQKSTWKGFLEMVKEEVCKNCVLASICWKEEFYETKESLREALAHLQKNGRIVKEELPAQIQRRCRNEVELLSALRQFYDLNAGRASWEKRWSEFYRLVNLQVSGMARMMRNLISEVIVGVGLEEEVQSLLEEKLKQHGMNFKRLKVFHCPDNLKVAVSKAPCNGEIDCMGKVMPLVEEAIGCKFFLKRMVCGQVTGSKDCIFNLQTAGKYEVTVGAAQTFPHKESICGDHYTAFELENQHVLLLSDGMGIGENAAQQSQAVISLLTRFLRAGFDLQEGVSMVNSVLFWRTPAETFATVDLNVIDLHSGMGKIMKVGAHPGFIKRGKEIITIEAGNLPVGILDSLELEVEERQLNAGDFLIMVTDGLYNGTTLPIYKWLPPLLREINTEDPQEIAEIIIDHATTRCKGIKRDDCTVLVARLDLRLV